MTKLHAHTCQLILDECPTLEHVADELAKAKAAHRGLNTPHEAIAVIREEYLEAEREVFMKVCDRAALRKELIQLATMCVRAIEDLGLTDAG